MAKNSIGQFIAALRKANGMTQQDVADRLNVSNKAVSRWERDECAPDISLIPALAEMLGVTCDELLKGERILDASPQEKKEPRVEKQVKNLINRTLSGFKTMIWISLAVAVAGYVFMMGISYGAYRPVIGFAVMILFEAVAFVLAVLAVNKAKAGKSDNEIFEEAEEFLISKFNKTLGTYSYSAFFTILSVVVLSLPFMFFLSEYVNSVLAFESYFKIFSLLALALAVVFFLFKKLFCSWITEQTYIRENTQANHKLNMMNVFQWVPTAAAGIIYIICPFFINRDKISAGEILYAVCLVFLVLNIVAFVLFMAKSKEDRKTIVLPGIRNMLMIIPALLLQKVHEVCLYGESIVETENTVWKRYDIWNVEYIWLALGIALFIIIVFKLIEMSQKEKR